MGEFPATHKVLRSVMWRLYLSQLSRRFAWSLFGSAAVYALVLGASRIGLIPDWFGAETLAVIPVCAAVIALLSGRFPKFDDAARAVDSQYQTRDLFLTLTMLEGAAGEYKPLVAIDAEVRASSVDPQKVVSLDLLATKGRQRQTALVVLSMGVLAAATLYVPQFDLFGKVADAKELDKKRIVLEDAKKATELRKAELAKKDADDENSEEVKQALHIVKQDLKKVQKGKKKENADLLNTDQKMLGEKFRGLASELKSLLNKQPNDQQFGSSDSSEMRKMQKELQEGNPEALTKKMDEIQQDLERLAKTEDPVKRAEMQRQIQKKMDELADLAKEAGAKSLAAALERAMEQVASSKDGKLSTEALEQAMQSMDLSKAELKELAQSVRDMKSLEEALKTLSMAKQLSNKDQLDGEMGEGASSLEDYEALYQEMMAKMQGEGMGEGEGDGDGTGGEGQGRGGRPPEDDSIKSDFVQEQAKTQVQKGKVLLSLKTKGLTDTGDVKKEYRQSIQAIKQSYEEAIEEEQVPPGYHDSIKKYFNNLEKSDGPMSSDPVGNQEPSN